MADSEQQDILGELIHIYECDEQHVSALIVPIDGTIRENLPVSIEDADSDTVYATTVTDTNGMINTTFALSPGTHSPIIKCGNDTLSIYDTGVVCHACSLTLTSDKDILSAADDDVATLTATLMGTESGYNGPLSNREVTFEVYKASDDTLIETLTATTNSNGEATVSYTSKGAGDLYIKSKCGLLTKTYDIVDAKICFDNAKIWNWGSSVTSGALDYISNYILSVGDELYIKLSSLPSRMVTGLTGSSGYSQFQKDGNTYRYYPNGNAISTSITTDSVIKIKLTSSNSQECYVDDVLVKSVTGNSVTSPKPMARKYNNDNFTFDYIYVL